MLARPTCRSAGVVRRGKGRGKDGRAVMSAGEHRSAAEKREKLREQGARRILKLNDDCMCRPVGRTDRRLTREAQGTAWGIVLRWREHAARAAGWDVRGGARWDVGQGRLCENPWEIRWENPRENRCEQVGAAVGAAVGASVAESVTRGVRPVG